MEEQRRVLLEMRFSTAFKIGLAVALGTLVVFLIPWLIILLIVGWSQTMPW